MNIFLVTQTRSLRFPSVTAPKYSLPLPRGPGRGITSESSRPLPPERRELHFFRSSDIYPHPAIRLAREIAAAWNRRLAAHVSPTSEDRMEWIGDPNGKPPALRHSILDRRPRRCGFGFRRRRRHGDGRRAAHLLGRNRSFCRLDRCELSASSMNAASASST